jgi:hypothetical protein
MEDTSSDHKIQINIGANECYPLCMGTELFFLFISFISGRYNIINLKVFNLKNQIYLFYLLNS